MTTFETVDSEEFEFDGDNFIQVAHKVARDEDTETEFIAITRGYLDSQGSRRYKTNLTLPADNDVVDEVIEGLLGVAGNKFDDD